MFLVWKFIKLTQYAGNRLKVFVWGTKIDAVFQSCQLSLALVISAFYQFLDIFLFPIWSQQPIKLFEEAYPLAGIWP